MIETIKNIGVVFSTILGAIALLTATIRPLRDKFIKFITKTSNVIETEKIIMELKNTICDSFDEIKSDMKDLKKESQLNREANRCVLSNRIADTYFKYYNEDHIPQEEKDSLLEHYQIYKKLGGNGKIEYKYNELIEKKTKIRTYTIDNQE